MMRPNLPSAEKIPEYVSLSMFHCRHEISNGLLQNILKSCTFPFSSTDGEKRGDSEVDAVDAMLKRPQSLRITETGESTEIITSDDTQCTFNPNSYHMLYVASKEAFLYKQNSFTRAKAVRCYITNE